MMHCVTVLRELRLVFRENLVQELLFLMPWAVIKKVWERLISRNHMWIPLLKIIETGRVVARHLGPNGFGNSQRKQNIMRPHVSPPLADL